MVPRLLGVIFVYSALLGYCYIFGIIASSDIMGRHFPVAVCASLERLSGSVLLRQGCLSSTTRLTGLKSEWC